MAPRLYSRERENDGINGGHGPGYACYVAQRIGWSKVAQLHIDVYHSVVRVPYGKAKYVFWEDE